MVVDTSAILAILLGEAEGRAFIALMQGDPVRLLSAVTRVEVTLVIESRKGEAGRADFERFLRAASINVVAVTPEQADAMPFVDTEKVAILPASTSAMCLPTPSPRPRRSRSCSRATTSARPICL